MKWYIAVGLMLCNVSWAFAPTFLTRHSGCIPLSPYQIHFPLSPPLSMVVEKSDLDDDSKIDEDEVILGHAEALPAVQAIYNARTVWRDPRSTEAAT
jgi:hypothetical protein